MRGAEEIGKLLGMKRLLCLAQIMDKLQNPRELVQVRPEDRLKGMKSNRYCPCV